MAPKFPSLDGYSDEELAASIDVTTTLEEWRIASSKRIDSRQAVDQSQHSANEADLTLRLIAAAAQKAESAARTMYYDAIARRNNLARIRRQAALVAASK